MGKTGDDSYISCPVSVLRNGHSFGEWTYCWGIEVVLLSVKTFLGGNVTNFQDKHNPAKELEEASKFPDLSFVSDNANESVSRLI